MLFHKDTLSNDLLRLFELVNFVVAVDLLGGARRIEAEALGAIGSTTVIGIRDTARLLRINVESTQISKSLQAVNLLIGLDAALRIETIVIVSLAHVWK